MADLIPTKELVKWGEKNVVDGIIKLALTPENKRYATQFLRYLITEAGLKTEKGKPAKPSNFPKVYFDGELTPFRNRAREGNLTVNNFNFTSAESKAKSDLKRSEGVFGLTKMEDVQLDFLIETQKLKDELAKSEFAGPSKRNKAYDKFDRRMKALFKKYRRVEVGVDNDGNRVFFRPGDYDPSNLSKYGLPEWYANLPEGTNIKDVYKKWKKDVDRNTKFPNQSKGHVYPVSQGGTSAPSNLVGEDASGNYASQDKEGTFRSQEDLAKVNVAYSGPMALQEFLTEYDPSVVSPTRFLETDRSKLNTDLVTDIQAWESQAEDNLLNQNIQNASLLRDVAHERILANKFSIGPNFFNKATIATENIGNMLGGPFQKISAGNQVLRGVSTGDTLTTISPLTKLLTTEEILPIKDPTKLTGGY